ncbi:hypothetical protein JW887_03270 [Candidatus Dojkabacteria bacterium]|nr:hypothetical protein [Candidatus Dojkabacteria bacterium]
MTDNKIDVSEYAPGETGVILICKECKIYFYLNEGRFLFEPENHDDEEGQVSGCIKLTCPYCGGKILYLRAICMKCGKKYPYDQRSAKGLPTCDCEQDIVSSIVENNFTLN